MKYEGKIYRNIELPSKVLLWHRGLDGHHVQLQFQRSEYSQGAFFISKQSICANLRFKVSYIRFLKNMCVYVRISRPENRLE